MGESLRKRPTSGPLVPGADRAALVSDPRTHPSGAQRYLLTLS